MGIFTYTIVAVAGYSIVVRVKRNVSAYVSEFEKAIHESNIDNVNKHQQGHGEVFLRQHIKVINHDGLIRLHQEYRNDKSWHKRFYNDCFDTTSTETANLINDANFKDSKGHHYIGERELADKVIGYMLTAKDKGFCLYLFNHIITLMKMTNPEVQGDVRINELPEHRHQERLAG